MLAFCGQDHCLMDGNGRVKLNQRHVDDFLAHGGGSLVMHGLPEGAIALYPGDTYARIRKSELESVDRIGSSFVARRSMRRFGSLTLPLQISGQGRVTIPPEFRAYAGLQCGGDILVIGVEIGIEIWNVERYQAEMAAIDEHWQQRSSQELARDIMAAPNE